MPILETAIVAGGTVVAVSAATASAYRATQAHASKQRDKDNTLEGLKCHLNATSERIRRKSSESDYGGAGSPKPLSPKHVPIFSYGDIAGVGVRLPTHRVDAKGLPVTKVLKGAWADSCGAKVGSRLVAVDGVPLEGKTADEVRRVVQGASRPLWLDIVSAARGVSSEDLSGEHMLL